jgi:hypothetical protein
MPTKYTKWSQHIPNGRKIDQHLPLQDPPKFTHIGVFGFKISKMFILTKHGLGYNFGRLF